MSVVDVKAFSGYAPYSDGPTTEWQPDKEKFEEGDLAEQARRRSSIAEGQIKHNQLGWMRLTVSHRIRTSRRLLISIP